MFQSNSIFIDVRSQTLLTFSAEAKLVFLPFPLMLVLLLLVYFLLSVLPRHTRRITTFHPFLTSLIHLTRSLSTILSYFPALMPAPPPQLSFSPSSIFVTRQFHKTNIFSLECASVTVRLPHFGVFLCFELLLSLSPMQ